MEPETRITENPPPAIRPGSDIEQRTNPIGFGSKVVCWFTSVYNGAETARRFKGKVGLGSGLLNLLVAYFIVDVISIPIYFLISGSTPPGVTKEIFFLLVIALQIVGLVSWLAISFLSHLLATYMGGQGSFSELAGLLTFPQSGVMILNLFFSWIPLLGGLVQLVLGIALVVSEVNIIKEEYSISGLKAFIAWLVPAVIATLILVGVAVALAVTLYASIPRMVTMPPPYY